MQGYYHSIETFGTVDGNGIRYVLFLTGCALGCRFCHNPDTWALGDKKITAHEILADYAKYRHYYNASGGGLTVSGGEPLLQAEFVAELFSVCRREGIHTTLDTAGYASKDKLEKVLPYTDAVLFGLKAALTDIHNNLTAGGLDTIVKNLRIASHSSAELTIRYILIPSVNDSAEELAALAQLVLSLERSAAVDILPYHTMGIPKWEQLGLAYSLGDIPPASESDLQRAKHLLTCAGVTVA